MDQLLPVPFDGLDGSLYWRPRCWRDIRRSDPIEIEQTGTELLTLDAAKDQLRVTFNDEDAWINDAIAPVRRQVEADLNQKLVAATLEMTFDQFPLERWLMLPMPPLLTVTSLSWFDYNGVETTLSPSSYLVASGTPGYVALAPGSIWPTGVRPFLGARIRWTAGAINAADRAVHAMKLLLGHFYANREAVTSGANRYTPDVYPLGYEALLSDRVVSFG